MVAGDTANLGTATARVNVDTSGVTQGMNRAADQFSSGVSRMSGGLTALGGRIQGVGAQISALGAPIALAMGAGVQAAANFESALVEIQTRAGLTADEMERVREKALQLGQDTAFSAGQAADAFLQLLTTGQSLSEAMATIDTVMTGAAASGENLGFVADAVTDVMAQFSTQNVTAAEVLTALNAAAGSSSATLSDLVQGFGNAGGVAASFGLNLDETAAILATFSENGIKGAEAGTQLRSMLNNMTRDTVPTKEAWAKLGLSMFDATGQARPLGDVLQDLRGALGAMNDEARIETITKLAGTYGQLGLTALTTGDSLEDMIDKMSATASASDIAAARMDTFQGSVAFLKGSVETLAIEVLTPYMNDVLKPLLQRQAAIIGSIIEWSKANPRLTSTIVKLLGLFAALGPQLFILGTIIKGVGLAMAFLLSPIGLLTVAIVALFTAWKSNFLGIRDLTAPVFEFLGNLFDGLSRTISFFVADLENFGLRQAFLALFGEGVGEAAESTLEGFFTIMGMGREDAIALTASLWNMVAPLFRLIDNFGILMNIFNQTGGIGINLEAMGFSERTAGIINAVVSAFMRFKDAIAGVPAIAVNLGERVWNIITALRVFIDTFDVLKRGFENFGSAAIGGFLSLMGIDGTTASILESVMIASFKIKDAFDAIKPLLDTVASTVGGVLGPAFEQLKFLVSDFVSTIGEEGLGAAIMGLLENFTELKTILFTEILKVFGLGDESARKLAETFTFLAGGVIRNVTKVILPTLIKMGKWFIEDGLPVVISFIEGTVIPAIGTFINIVGGIWDTVSSGLITFKDWFLDVLPSIVSFIETKVIPVFKKVGSAISTGIGIAVDAVRSFIGSLSGEGDGGEGGGLSGVVAWLEEFVMPIFEETFGLIKTVIDNVIPIIINLAEELVKLFPSFLTVLEIVLTELANLIGIVNDIAEVVLPLLRIGINIVIDVIGFLIDKIVDVMRFFQRLRARLFGIKTVFESVFNGIKDVVISVFDFIIEKIDFVLDKIKSVTDALPSLAIGGETGLLSEEGLLGLGGVPILAHGAIATGPSNALIGEALGPGEFEAVLPSPMLQKLMEDVIRAAQGGGGTTVQVVVPAGAFSGNPESDGARFGDAIARELRRKGLR